MLLKAQSRVHHHFSSYSFSGGFSLLRIFFDVVKRIKTHRKKNNNSLLVGICILRGWDWLTLLLCGHQQVVVTRAAAEIVARFNYVILSAKLP